MVTNVAAFRFEDTPVNNENGTITINKYYETYSNTDLYDYPKQYPIRRYIIYYLPPRFDPKDWPVTLNITSGLVENFVTYERTKNRIIIDKK